MEPDRFASILQQLLYRFDCLAIPGFGGFVMQYRPASYDARRQKFDPPARVIRFNALLQDDDGLLTKELADRLQVAYPEARKEVALFVTNGQEVLNSGKSWEIKGLGVFILNEEKAVQFEPAAGEHFLASSFGLSSVNAQVFKAAPRPVRLARKPADRKPAPSGSKLPASARWITAMALPVILFLLYGIITPSSMQKIYTGYAGWVFRQSVLHSSWNGKVKNEALPIPGPVLVKEAETTPPNPAPATPVNQESMTGPRYHVIGGAFLDHDNAFRFLDALKESGYKAETAGTNGRGQLRVSYQSFGTLAEAESFLQYIRGHENPAAWILKY
jgi:nucleoid DNA-binding protein